MGAGGSKRRNSVSPTRMTLAPQMYGAGFPTGAVMQAWQAPMTQVPTQPMPQIIQQPQVYQYRQMPAPAIQQMPIQQLPIQQIPIQTPQYLPTQFLTQQLPQQQIMPINTTQWPTIPVPEMPVQLPVQPPQPPVYTQFGQPEIVTSWVPPPQPLLQPPPIYQLPPIHLAPQQIHHMPPQQIHHHLPPQQMHMHMPQPPQHKLG